MKKITIADWDPAEYIRTKEDVMAHLEVALEAHDPEFLLETIGHIARSQGITEMTRDEQTRLMQERDPRAQREAVRVPAMA
ncbi:MAG: hypothetical protein LBS86_02220 [Treponema sp.]|jgi:probable addiction module antidote protein|nr:hypothetical protein [Treponema sp.]